MMRPVLFSSDVPASEKPEVASTLEKPTKPTMPFSIIAHRGARTVANHNDIGPENAMKAFHQAEAMGADIELDVQATKDGVVFAYHDDTFERVFKDFRTELVKPVTSYSWHELSNYVRFDPLTHQQTVEGIQGEKGYTSVGANFRSKVPTLQQILTEIKNAHLYIELKTTNYAAKSDQNNRLEEKVVDLIQRFDAYDRVTVISFSPESLKKVQQLDPKIDLGLDVKLPPVVRKYRRLGRLYIKTMMAGLSDSVSSIHPPYEQVTSWMVEMCREWGKTLTPWVSKQTRNEEVDEIKRLQALGVDGVITNAVDIAQSVVQ